MFKNNLLCKNDLHDLLKTFAEENGIMSQPQKMLISSFTLQNGTLITPLLLFLSWIGSPFYNFTPHRWVDARRQGDENPNSIVVAETIRLLARSSYGYQCMDRSRHTLTKYRNVKKTHAALNRKHFTKLYHLNKALSEILILWDKQLHFLMSYIVSILLVSLNFSNLNTIFLHGIKSNQYQHAWLKVDDNSCDIFLWLFFPSWLVFPFIVFQCMVFCKR